MRITLYQNCILTDAYSEVFDVFLKDNNNKTALERYLETLIKTTYEVDDVFITNTGKFTFEANDNKYFHGFNYMKVEDTDNDITRYAFIETITIVNGLAVVNYIEDVWSNYASTMKIRNSLLTRSRIIDYGNYQIPYYTIDVEYESNEKPKLTCLSNNLEVGVDALPKDCNLVLTLQTYSPVEQGVVSARQSRTFVVSSLWSDETTELFDRKPASWLEQLTSLVFWSSSEKIHVPQVSTGGVTWNYEISSAYLIPKEYNILSIKNSTHYGKIATTAISGDDGVLIPGGLFTMYELYTPSTTGALQKTTTYSNIPNNFKRIGIGGLTHPVSITNNGSSVDVDIFCSVDNYSFYLYMGVQGQLHEITDNYEVLIPIQVQSADVTQQQKTARAVETLNGTLQVVGGISSIAGSAGAMGISNRMLQAGKARNQIGTEMAGTNAVVGNAYGIVGGATSVVRGITNIVTANLKMFTTNKGLSVKSNAVMNACYGLVDITIVADNEVEVNALLKESGYVCNEIVGISIFSAIQTGLANKYNVVMFDYIKLHGNFSQRIGSALREILTNGVKIWYDETAIYE